MNSYLCETLEKYGIKVNKKQEEQLKGYMLSILEYNKSINLTAIREEEEFVLKHYVDSLTPLMDEDLKKEILEKAKKVLDLGTGGGFPGVPFAIMLPQKEFTLLDSLNKRLKIIDELCLKYEISNVRTLHGRAEDIGRMEGERESYDICVSRAVSHMSVLAEYALPFVKTGGLIIAYKGWDIDTELKESKEAIKLLGGEIEKIIETPTEEKLVVLRKIKNTPGKYPRKAGEPKKNPLGHK